MPLYNQRLPAALAWLIQHPAYGSWRIKQDGLAPSVAPRPDKMSQDLRSCTAEEEITGNLITGTGSERQTFPARNEPGLELDHLPHMCMKYYHAMQVQ